LAIGGAEKQSRGGNPSVASGSALTARPVGLSLSHELVVCVISVIFRGHCLCFLQRPDFAQGAIEAFKESLETILGAANASARGGGGGGAKGAHSQAKEFSIVYSLGVLQAASIGMSISAGSPRETYRGTIHAVPPGARQGKLFSRIPGRGTSSGWRTQGRSAQCIASMRTGGATCLPPLEPTERKKGVAVSKPNSCDYWSMR